LVCLGDSRYFLRVGLKQFDRKFGCELYRELPTAPGVYLFKDGDDVVLYVGKAKNLRRRLQGYRNASRRKAHRKMRAVVREASSLEVRPLESERQALLLENELIRTLQPTYNVDGAFFFLYPAVGLWRNDAQTVLCFTTSQEAYASVPFDWYGTFRSRTRTKEAFDALVTLLSYLGHLEPKSRLPEMPRVRGSRLVGVRRLAPDLVETLKRYWSGGGHRAIEDLAQRLLERPAARIDSGQVQEALRLLDEFYRGDVERLNSALRSLGREAGFVPQQERDALFIESRAG
jgi:predicted GIY-YIG superfamily endonuclease